jgi:hypothetical protein
MRKFNKTELEAIKTMPVWVVSEDNTYADRRNFKLPHFTARITITAEGGWEAHDEKNELRGSGLEKDITQAMIHINHWLQTELGKLTIHKKK